ncbi:hypothetical protein [Thermocoleostomius sinensis]|uniref:Uncharacterized protein n=1 Tax=Thermocoleostomius sinensis A174 TaxID=2016057 RepID=A0A9E8Z9W5_9CYAN|nr:hypothetical protein [Thermocoleostomius sinensis]WAL59245.1 hypothetical protein OXH18_19010 [Thermocoleostomius sinensis A174]
MVQNLQLWKKLSQLELSQGQVLCWHGRRLCVNAGYTSRFDRFTDSSSLHVFQSTANYPLLEIAPTCLLPWFSNCCSQAVVLKLFC